MSAGTQQEQTRAEIARLLEGHTGRAAEARVLALLSGTSDSDLDAVLSGLDLARLVRGLDDRLIGPDHRSELLHLLLRDRVTCLSVPTLAGLAHGLGRWLTPHADEQAVRDLVLHLQGGDLTLFKALVNSTGDHHDLEHLVFGAIDDDALRRQVLNHIAAEARGRPSPDLKILSDIDDTVVSMLHDRRYPRGTTYPGVEAFLTELDHGAAAAPGSPGDLTFITARPTDPRGLVEQYTRDGLAHLDLPPHSVMTGSILNLLTKGRIAARKLDNFDRYRQLFPECRVIFVGDSGQADPQVGAEMLRRDPDHVEAVLIHDVVGLAEPERRAMREQGIELFDTYAGAAAIVHRHGLITDDGLRRVVDAVRTGLSSLDLDEQQRRALLAAVDAETAATGSE